MVLGPKLNSLGEHVEEDESTTIHNGFLIEILNTHFSMSEYLLFNGFLEGSSRTKVCLSEDI